MPYVRRYFSQQEHDSSLEPSVKKSKLDYTELCNKTNGEEYIALDTKPQRWGSSGFSETRYYGSHKGERKHPRVTEQFQNDSAQLKQGSYKHYSSESPSRREDGNKNQQVKEIPKADNWKPNNCDAAFSETSTSFIGPLYQPPPQVHSRTSHNDSSKPPSRITTVEVGKAAHKTKRVAGIDNELHQFYKELHELEETTDNHNASQTGADSEQHPIHHYHPSNAPTIQQVRNHCQTPSSQPCDPFSSKPSAPIPPSSHRAPPPVNKLDPSSHHTEAYIFPAAHRAPPPVNKLDPSSHHTEAHIFPAAHRTLPPVNKLDPSSHYTEAHIFPAAHRAPPPVNKLDPSSHHTEAYVFPAEHRALPPVNKLDPSSHHTEAHIFPAAHRAPPPVNKLDPSYHHTEAYIFPAAHRTLPPVNKLDPSSHHTEAYVFAAEHRTLPPVNKLDPSSHHTEAYVFPAEHRALPPVNKPDPCDRPRPLDKSNSSFLNQSLPPPGFQGPLAPSFPVHHGPPPLPPPRYNYPMTLPRQNNIPNSPYNESENYQRINDHHLRPPTQFPCNNSYLPPENRFSPQGRCYTEPFPKPPDVFSEQTYERKELNGQNRHFGHITPKGDHVHHEQYPNRFRDNPSPCMEFKRKLVLLRGVPGSGKSTLARFLLDRTPDGIVFSTDDYFCQDSRYAYDVKLLGDAHSWNQDRARRAMDDGRSPIIIDNTNIQGWEMKPYVQMAIDRGYDVEFLEPNTWWKLDAQELEKRNTHRVPRDKISQMLERYECDMNVAVVMNSVEPRRGRPSRAPPEDRQRWGASVDDYTQHSKSFQIR